MYFPFSYDILNIYGKRHKGERKTLPKASTASKTLHFGHRGPVHAYTGFTF